MLLAIFWTQILRSEWSLYDHLMRIADTRIVHVPYAPYAQPGPARTGVQIPMGSVRYLLTGHRPSVEVVESASP